jgi:hypothetical protein
MVMGIEYALSMKPTVNAVVVITDGYTRWPQERPRNGMSVVACIVGPGGYSVAEQAPGWITKVVVDDDE